MPFAGYSDFDDCVAKNQDKRNPDAYCAAIMRAVEDDAKPPKRTHLIFRRRKPKK